MNCHEEDIELHLSEFQMCFDCEENDCPVMELIVENVKRIIESMKSE